MNLLLDGLIAWGALSLPAGIAIGSALRKARKGLPRPSPTGLSRAEQHQHDAKHNPNYRGGAR